MNLAINIIAVFVAILHIYFLVLEMFLWTKPKGLKIFAQTLEQAQSSAALAANQGLYNGFLSAGLIWGLLHPQPDFSRQIITFFFACVVVAGIYGGATVNKKIFFIQSIPALLGLILLQLT